MLPYAEELFRRCRRSLHTTEMSEQWSAGEITWTRSQLTAVYYKHHSRMPPEFVVASDVMRSTGGSMTTSLNGQSATYRTGV